MLEIDGISSKFLGFAMSTLDIVSKLIKVTWLYFLLTVSKKTSDSSILKLRLGRVSNGAH